MPISEIHFDNIEFLWFLLAVPLYILWHYKHRRKQNATMTLSHAFEGITNDWISRIRPALNALRILALSMAVVAFARPVAVDTRTEAIEAEGISIVMAMDISASMLSKDLKPNRLEALKKVAIDFIDSRYRDKIGVVAYSGEAFTICPLTSDHKIAKNAIKDVKYGLLEGGTAIGTGLGTAINRLDVNDQTKEKVVILLTDGVNNSGNIDPKTIAEIAHEKNIRVYTIAMGTNGTAYSPIGIDPMGKLVFKDVPVEIDEELLREIAKITGGRYFRATDNEKLERIYEEIDEIETYKIEETKYYKRHEYFRVPLLLAFGLLLLDIILRMTWFKSFI